MYLFLDLFSNLHYSNFKCDTYIVAKSHYMYYLISMNKSEISFALIHPGVWGPSPIIATSSIFWFVTFVNDCTKMT